MNGRWEIDRSRIAWWFVAAVLTIAIVYVVYSFIGTFVLGLFLYYATRPVYRRIRLRIPQRDIAVAVSLVALALPAILLVAYTIAIGLQEVGRLTATGTQFAQLQDTLEPYIDASSIARDPQSILTGQNVGTVRDVLDSMLEYIGTLGNATIHLFLVLALAFYLLRDDRRLSTWFRERFGDDRGVLEAYLDAVDGDFHSVFFGNILNAVLTGTIGALMYNIVDLVAPAGLGLPSPTLFGLLTGAASLVPVVGMKLVYFPMTAYLLAGILFVEPSQVWYVGLFFLVSLVIVDTIPDLVLRPYVSGRNLHVGMVMFAYILGPLLFGWYGLFLGPIILVLVVDFARIVLPELLAGEPIDPWAADQTTDNMSHNADKPAEHAEDHDNPAEGSGTSNDVESGSTDGSTSSAGVKQEGRSADDTV